MTEPTGWLKARLQLLEKEKAYVKAGDELAKLRRALPSIAVNKSYVFTSVDGPVTLADLFGRNSQLIVQHFMFGEDWEAGCPACSFWADGFDPMIVHLNQRDVSFVASSRAPLDKLLAYRRRMGWSFQWVSSQGSDFSADFGVAPSPENLADDRMTYNYRERDAQMSELPGVSVFKKEPDGTVFHTYSTYARGLDRLNGAYGYLDLAPHGRNEDELPFTMSWVRRHDEYED